MSTSAMLKADPKLEIPALPDVHDDGWHAMTAAWWADVWSSPMAPEFDVSDRHGLFMVAVLVDMFWQAGSPRDRRDLAAEIRLQSQRFGLSPVDRRRLQWEIERASDAQEKGARRRAQPPAAAKSSKSTTTDPRSVLRVV